MENSYLEVLNNRRQIEFTNIKNCNKYTSKYGLTLSDNDIGNILKKREETLKNTGRIEFREGIIDKLIKEFCDSQYIAKENYMETLYKLVDIFYEYKNETMDLITDDELIKFMKKSFEGVAGGDLEYLSGTIMYKMKKELLKGKPLN